MADDSEWIEWAGGECPVPSNTLVEIRFRDGEEWLNEMACTAGAFCPESKVSTPKNDNWLHDGSDCDIIAYRLVQS